MPVDTIQVKPKPKVIQYVRLNIYQLVLNWGFKCACYLLDAQGIVIEQQDVVIEGEEYNSWLSDDEMVLVILEKLGLEPTEGNASPEGNVVQVV